MLGVTVDWTQVLIVGVPAYIAALGAAVAAVVGSLNRRALQTPSGDPIGHVVERAHDLAAVNAAAMVTKPNATMDKSASRLNDDPKSPVSVENAQP